jgi:hypothetical protein
VTRQQSVAQTQVYGNYYDVGSYGSGYYRDASSVSNTLNEQGTRIGRDGTNAGHDSSASGQSAAATMALTCREI